jgi:hypothetical protein
MTTRDWLTRRRRYSGSRRIYENAYDYLLGKPPPEFETDTWRVKIVDGWKEHQKRGVVIYWARFDDGFLEGEWEFAIVCRPPNEEVKDYYEFPQTTMHTVIDMEFSDMVGGKVGHLGEMFVEELNKQLTEGHFKKKFEEIIDKNHIHRG